MKTLVTLIPVLFLAAGCTHTARITNAKQFTPATARPAQRVTLGFAPVESDRLLNAAIAKVRADAAVADCREGFQFGGEFRPDYVCRLSRDTKFKAAGQNFFITFPGFIVFTHALVGYKYTADIQTHSTLLDMASNEVSRISIATPIEFRHCSFARGAAAGCCGWLVPGWGAAAVLPGAIFAGSYDKRATAEFMEKAELLYGGYTASRILEQIQQTQTNGAHAARSARPGPQMAIGADDAAAEPEAANEGEYAVYVMDVTGNTIGVPASEVRQLPPAVRATLDRMSQTGLAADEGAMGDVLTALGVSPERFFGQLGQAQVYTQIDDRVVPLRKPAGSVSPLL